MERGIVKWYNPRLGYGFIGRPGRKADVFLHFSGLVDRGARRPDPGDAVSFDLGEGRHGPKAVNARVFSPRSSEPSPSAEASAPLER
ncbi:cold shock domain-containing protein [Nocardia sp. CA2R105]|nr:cold shock domain-containing protein [Nocardia coffeae]